MQSTTSPAGPAAFRDSPTIFARRLTGHRSDNRLGGPWAKAGSVVLQRGGGGGGGRRGGGGGAGGPAGLGVEGSSDGIALCLALDGVRQHPPDGSPTTERPICLSTGTGAANARVPVCRRGAYLTCSSLLRACTESSALLFANATGDMERAPLAAAPPAPYFEATGAIDFERPCKTVKISDPEAME